MVMVTEHTDKKYEEELKKLREEILYMGGLVEDQIQKAVKTLVDRDSELAAIIIERDHEVNRLDVEIDERCIRLLALHQPAGFANGCNDRISIRDWPIERRPSRARHHSSLRCGNGAADLARFDLARPIRHERKG